MKRTAIRYSFLIMLILPLFAHGQASMKMSAGQVDAARWIETRFARGKVPPFSFVYGDKSSKSLLPGWNYSMKRLPGDDPDVVKYLYTYTERPSGLKVECFVTGFPAFDAVEWVLHFTNTGKSDSRVLEQVKVVDLDMQRAGRRRLHAVLCRRKSHFERGFPSPDDRAEYDRAVSDGARRGAFVAGRFPSVLQPDGSVGQRGRSGGDRMEPVCGTPI